MSKRFLRSGLLAIILTLCIGINVFASPVKAMEPRWSYVDAIGGKIEIDNGIAKCIAFGDSRDPVTSIYQKISLQRLEGNSWKSIKEWEDTWEGQFIQYTKTYAVYKGYSYRIVVTVKVYQNGSLKETVSGTFDYGEYK